MKEPLKSFVPEGLDHVELYLYTIQMSMASAHALPDGSAPETRRRVIGERREVAASLPNAVRMQGVSLPRCRESAGGR
ncbi:MAG: hypothetical protein WAW79_07335, partial [Steroidobacteraceae bacterium]